MISLSARRLVALLLGCLLLACYPARAAEKSDDAWLQCYYQHPQPERLEGEFAKLWKAKALRSPNSMPALAAFLSRVFRAASPEQVERWCKFVRNLPSADRKVFLIALRWAETPAAASALQSFADRSDATAADARDLLHSPAPDFAGLTNPEPGELDMCWGAFFATGEAVYALPVIRCAAGSSQPGVVDLTQAAARWSLKSLCRGHARVREIRDTFYETATPEQRRSLDELFKR